MCGSEDYGKSFQDVTKLINNTFIRSEFGIAIGPENSGKVCHMLGELSQISRHRKPEFTSYLSFLNFQVILTADVSGNHGSRIFVSGDFGKSFTPQQLPFFPFMQITYNPENSSVLMALSTKASSEYAVDMVYLKF